MGDTSFQNPKIVLPGHFRARLLLGHEAKGVPRDGGFGGLSGAASRGPETGYGMMSSPGLWPVFHGVKHCRCGNALSEGKIFFSQQIVVLVHLTWVGRFLRPGAFVNDGDFLAGFAAGIGIIGWSMDGLAVHTGGVKERSNG